MVRTDVQIYSDIIQNILNVGNKYKCQKENMISNQNLRISLQKFNNGVSFRSAFCAFNNLILSSSTSQNMNERDVKIITDKVNTWINAFKALNVNSAAGYIYFITVLQNIKAVIKVPRDSVYIYDAMLEYFACVSCINNLRYFIPNFMGGLGIFLCSPSQNSTTLCDYNSSSKNTPFCIYEKVEGQTFEQYVKKVDTDFSDFLEVFIQVLIALEVAQREYSFTHYDLHGENVIIKTIDNTNGSFSYKVPLDNCVYEITPRKSIAVIIDYGMCSYNYEGKIYGQPVNYGQINNFGSMNLGYDMYRLLIYIYDTSERLHRKLVRDNPGNPPLNKYGKMRELFRFYGNEDIYDVYNKTDGYTDAANEYCKRVITSNTGTFTPLSFLNWILDHHNFKDTSRLYVRKNPVRNIYTPLNSKTLKVQEDYKIYGIDKTEMGRRISALNPCFGKNNFSYLFLIYNIYLAEKYKLPLSTINDMKDRKIKFGVLLLKIDAVMLTKYVNIQIPERSDRDVITTLNNFIRTSNIEKSNRVVLTQTLQTFSIYLNFVKKLDPYLKCLYMIRELKNESSYITYVSFYTEWENDFLSSRIYNLYANNLDIINRSVRWLKCIEDFLAVI